MHIVITILIAVAGLLFWLGRAASGAREIADTAQEISNIPRKMRYRKKAGKRALSLIENPVEAATVLMISIARMENVGRISDRQADGIATQLAAHMQMERPDAEDMILQMRSLTEQLKQPDSTLYPMVDLLKINIDRQDAQELSAMLQDIAVIDGPINSDQINFIRRFEERMGIGTWA